MTIKTRCGGRMTEAQFVSFVKSQLRGASWKWGVTSDVLKAARQARGWYLCNICHKVVPSTIVEEGKRKKNVVLDHEPPVVDPLTGFSGWDDFINRLYCESDHLQVICLACDREKQAKEREIRKANKKKKEE